MFSFFFVFLARVGAEGGVEGGGAGGCKGESRSNASVRWCLGLFLPSPIPPPPCSTPSAFIVNMAAACIGEAPAFGPAAACPPFALF